MTLDPIQLRVLGALIEKEITTPENYPLSLNSLISACNQRSSRDPVLDLTEDEVRQAVHSLEDMEVVSPVRDARVPKYEHRIRTVLNLRRDETALLCLLMLRGPQTPGELRGRADRMFSFDDIAAVQSTLERLANRGLSADTDAARGPDSGPDPKDSGTPAIQPLAVMLPRQPGSRESRFAHLLGGQAEAAKALAGSANPQLVRATSFTPNLDPEMATSLPPRVAALEETVRLLRLRLDAIEFPSPGVEAKPKLPDHSIDL